MAKERDSVAPASEVDGVREAAVPLSGAAEDFDPLLAAIGEMPPETYPTGI